MANERLNIPETLKVGFNKRTDTYSGKLAYVTYINAKNEIAKEKSWNGWIDKSIDVETYENKPMEGFVLNKRAGGYKSGWNFRQTKCRVYDPRGFEIEISVENLLYILQECTSSKGKGLEGEFVYAWSGPELILLPVCSEDYISSMELKNKKEKITIKDLKLGASYKTKVSDYLIYIGKMDWYFWTIKEQKSSNRYISSEYWYELEKITLPTFVDVNEKTFKGIKNADKIDYLIEENTIALDEVENYKDMYKQTVAYQNQFINKLTTSPKKDTLENFLNKKDYNHFYRDINAQMLLPDGDILTITIEKKAVYEGLTFYQWAQLPKNRNISNRDELEKIFVENSKIEFSYRKCARVSFDGKKLSTNYYQHSMFERDFKPLTDDIIAQLSDGSVYDVWFDTKNGNKLPKWSCDSKSLTSVKFNESYD